MAHKGVCKLANGQAVKYNLKERYQGKYSVCFVSPTGERIERATGEKVLARAYDQAHIIIPKEFQTPADKLVEWDRAITELVAACKAQNLRPESMRQYKVVLKALRAEFPAMRGPTDISPTIAQKFKILRSSKVRPRTLKNNITNLQIIFGRWFGDTLKLVSSNPFAAVEPPKLDKPKPRIITPAEDKAWRKWLANKYPNWQLPHTFLDVKAATGCRITELAKALSADLKNGRITFLSETSKGRKEKAPLLPSAVFKTLDRQKGPKYVFERFAEQLRAIEPHAGEFTPAQLVDWMQERKRQYLRQNPNIPYFKLHNYRGTLMSKAQDLGISPGDAAIAFHVDPQTAAKYYLARDEQKKSDEVFRKLNGSSGRKVGEKLKKVRNSRQK